MPIYSQKWKIPNRYLILKFKPNHRKITPANLDNALEKEFGLVRHLLSEI